MMPKNIQVIDGANNCTYNIYRTSDEDFALMFPDGQDIEFVEDFWDRVGDDRAGEIARRLYGGLVHKSQAHGIHGTLFIHLKWQKGHLYPSKKFSDDGTSLF